jgi:hypothetical protein
MVTHDTTVKVDTNVKRGDKATRVDTVKKTGLGMGKADTSSAH